MLIPLQNILAVVQLANQPKGVIHQVILSPEKVRNGIIRLGEFPGDEILGWQHLANVEVVETLGEAVQVEPYVCAAQPGKWVCKPFEKETAE